MVVAVTSWQGSISVGAGPLGAAQLTASSLLCRSLLTHGAHPGRHRVEQRGGGVVAGGGRGDFHHSTKLSTPDNMALQAASTCLCFEVLSPLIHGVHPLVGSVGVICLGHLLALAPQ
jgi:hypothetical protein